MLVYLGEKHPEYVVEQEPWEEESGDLETGQSDECYEGDTETHSHEVHESPVASEDPDTDHTDGNAHGEYFCQSEPPTQPQGDLPLGGAGSDEVLTHRQQEEGQGYRGDHCGTNGEQQLEMVRVTSDQAAFPDCASFYLHWVEEKKHYQQRERSAERKTHGLYTVQCRHVAVFFLLFLFSIFTLPFLLHWEGAKGSVDNEEDGDEECWDSGGVHDVVGQGVGLCRGGSTTTSLHRQSSCSSHLRILHLKPTFQ